jgi:hypothetical protein
MDATASGTAARDLQRGEQALVDELACFSAPEAVLCQRTGAAPDPRARLLDNATARGAEGSFLMLIAPHDQLAIVGVTRPSFARNPTLSACRPVPELGWCS